MSEQTMTKEQCVYFILAEGLNIVKIGVANNPDRRLLYMQVGSPVALRLLGTIAGSFDTERELHNRFQRHRSHGEWFFLAGEVETYIREVCFLDRELRNIVFANTTTRRLEDSFPSDFLLNMGPTKDIQKPRSLTLQKADEFFRVNRRVMFESELSELLNVPLEEIVKARKQGKIRCFKIGRGGRYYIHHIEDMLDRKVFD